MLHSKNKIAFNWFCRGYWLWPWGICMVFAVYLVLPWGLWFCREVFGFVVKVVGHRTVCTWKPIIRGNSRSLFPLQFYKDDLKQFGVQALLFRPVSDYSFHGSERFCKLTPEISHFLRKISSVSDLSREKVHTVSRNVPCSAAVRTSWSRISLYL